MGNSSGVTLLETLLVLAIASSIIILGMNQFQMASKDADIQRVQYTVDTLFQGMTSYYNVYCKNAYDPNTASNNLQNRAGSLDPRDEISTPLAHNPFPIVSGSGDSNLLVKNNFVSDSNWPPLGVNFVDTTAGDNGYVTQFNLTETTTPTRNPTAYYNNWLGSSEQLQVQLTNVGKIYQWRSQVAVKIRGNNPTALAAIYAKRLGATCTSSASSGDEALTVTPCAPGSAGEYVVWERSPLYGSTQTRSLFWLTTKRIKQSNKLYTNDDMYGASNANWIQSNGNVYLCGG